MQTQQLNKWMLDAADGCRQDERVESGSGKRYVEAGSFLAHAMRSEGRTVAGVARAVGVPEPTLRSYRYGHSAPRRGDPIWQGLESILGSEAVIQYRNLVEGVRLTPDGKRRSPDLIRTLIDRGRLREAQALIETTSEDEARSVAQLNLHLARALFAAGDATRGTDAYVQAIESATELHIGRDRLVEELAARLTTLDRYDDAIEILRSELRAAPRSGRLWRRLGIVQWYGHYLTDAYASLTAARDCGVPLPRVAHARGQVLSELGQHSDALRDLEAAMSKPLTEASRGYALSAHAFSSHALGSAETAHREFEEAGRLAPHNAWNSWRVAVCAEQSGDEAEALQGFRRSLSEQTPALNLHKRGYAEAAIRRIMIKNAD